MTTVIMNPGTGPCDGATIDNAYENMRAFLRDSGIPDAEFHRDTEATEDDESGGRFAFLVTTPWGTTEEVLMPGLPLKRVRIVNTSTQNCPEYPRLYVGGNSYWWLFGLLEPPHSCGLPWCDVVGAEDGSLYCEKCDEHLTEAEANALRTWKKPRLKP